MKRWLPHPLLTPVLAIVWLLLNNSLEPGQILLGLLLGWAIPRFTLPFWPERVRFYSPRAAARFAAVFFHDVVVANLAVAAPDPRRAAPPAALLRQRAARPHQRSGDQPARQHDLPDPRHRVGAAVRRPPPPAGARPRLR